MTRADRAILLEAVVHNLGAVGVHALLGALLIGSTAFFSVLLALYLGHDVLQLRQLFPGLSLLDNGAAIIAVATVLAAVALSCRLGQLLLEARVLTGAERQFAEQIRKEGVGATASGTVARASNHFGRLTVAGMGAVSAAVVLGLSLGAMLVIAPLDYAMMGAGFLAVSALGLYFVMRVLSSAMGEASQAMVAHAKATSAWKLDATLPESPEVAQYFRAYRRRVFLGSAFGFTGAIFAVLFCVAILVAREVWQFDFDLGQAFVAFVVLQSLVSLVGRFFGAIVKAAAFVPAVRAYRGGGTVNAVPVGADADSEEDIL